MAKSYPPDIWLAAATREDIAAGVPVKEAYARALERWYMQDRLAAEFEQQRKAKKGGENNGTTKAEA